MIARLSSRDPVRSALVSWWRRWAAGRRATARRWSARPRRLAPAAAPRLPSRRRRDPATSGPGGASPPCRERAARQRIGGINDRGYAAEYISQSFPGLQVHAAPAGEDHSFVAAALECLHDVTPDQAATSSNRHTQHGHLSSTLTDAALLVRSACRRRRAGDIRQPADLVLTAVVLYRHVRHPESMPSLSGPPTPGPATAAVTTVTMSASSGSSMGTWPKSPNTSTLPMPSRCSSTADTKAHCSWAVTLLVSARDASRWLRQNGGY